LCWISIKTIESLRLLIFEVVMQEVKLSSELVATTCFAGSGDASYQKEIVFEGLMFIHDGNNVSEDRTSMQIN